MESYNNQTINPLNYNSNSTYILEETQVSPVMPPIPPVLTGHLFMEFEVLSTKVTQKEMDEFNSQMMKYNDEVTRYESFGMNPDELDKPSHPAGEESATYGKININMADKIFGNWVEDWDEKNECATITVEYYPRIGGMIEQMTLKMVRSQWLDIINKLGAIALVTSYIPTI
jgi:hypothetical protein